MWSQLDFKNTQRTIFKSQKEPNKWSFLLDTKLQTLLQTTQCVEFFPYGAELCLNHFSAVATCFMNLLDCKLASWRKKPPFLPPLFHLSHCRNHNPDIVPTHSLCSFQPTPIIDTIQPPVHPLMLDFYFIPPLDIDPSYPSVPDPQASPHLICLFQ